MQYDKAAWEKMGNSFTNNYEIGITDFRQNIIDTVIKLQPECSNLLDVACADGWFIEQLRKFGFNKNYKNIVIGYPAYFRKKLFNMFIRYVQKNRKKDNKIKNCYQDMAICDRPNNQGKC
jgi:hypothetical protein